LPDDCSEDADLKKKLRAICFDADGVVVYPQLQFSRYLNQKYGISPEMTREFFRGVFNDCLVGKALSISSSQPGWNVTMWWMLA
jgi:hypothetical protein